MIEVRNLYKRFSLSRRQRREQDHDGQYLEAVQDVSFTCRPGRIFCLLGPNGAGKTTTLRIIATMLRPSAGTVRVAGHSVTSDPRAVRRRLGFLTGATALYDRLTPDELVAYYARLHGLSEAEWKPRRAALYDQLDMHSFSGRRIAKLSTGMKQKVSIVRAMIHDPPVIVLDEVTSGLDVLAARSIIGLVRHCKEDGKTVIFSTHRMDEVSLLADDLAIMHEGCLRYDGSFEAFTETMQADTLEDEFIRLVGARPDVEAPMRR